MIEIQIYIIHTHTYSLLTFLPWLFYSVMDAQHWHQESYCYDIISCLNVLDRCDCPLTMLRHIHDRLQPGGLLVLALVLPYEPFVERGEIEMVICGNKLLVEWMIDLLSNSFVEFQ